VKICPNCGYQNREGYMFCEDCGENLTQVESASSELPLIKPARGITLYITSSPEPVRVQERARTVLGRLDPQRRLYPDIDLTAYGGVENGVSGLHATIQHNIDGVQIMDMGSTNGTYVNGRKLAPRQYYILKDGDTIRLGKLEATISIVL
jgi:pSer/pThr/pTyr-binding forkhead associated (FHA) protein